MSRRPVTSWSLTILLTVVAAGRLAAPAMADVRPHAGMLRNPDVSATQIVFSYANDLWVVPREGGLASPLASPPGLEAFPRFSPDGQTIAFMANYDGNTELYTLPVGGGIPFRVTYHPATEILCDWTADNRLLFFSNQDAPIARMTQLFTVAPTGGLPEKLPVPYGANGAISPDGTWLAYTLHTADNRTWTRYRGGMATDIWLFNLRDHTSKKITDWEGTDSQPMWQGDKIYYMSDDGPSHKLNIWVYDTKTAKREQVTQFADFDIKWPAIGPGPSGQGEIVFQHGKDLYLLDLATRQSHAVEVIIPGDRPTLRTQRIDEAGFIQGAGISPTGKEAVFLARGDIWTIPAHKGTPKNLTRTAGAHERNPIWSPDGRWIAYLSDSSGEYELYVRQSDGQDEPRQLTHDGPGFRYAREWSPDSKYIVYTDEAGHLYLYELDGGKITLVDTDPWAQQPDFTWSHDSAWLAYSRVTEAGTGSLWLYQVKPRDGQRLEKPVQLTSGMFSDNEPVFDRKGDYLYFVSHRKFDDVIYGDVDGTWVYVNAGQLCVAPLRAAVGSPWAPKVDAEKWTDEKSKQEAEAKEKAAKEKDAEKEKSKEAGKKSTDQKEGENPQTQPTSTTKPDETATKPAEAKQEEPKPIEIEVEGFERRVIALPVGHGHLHNLAVNDEGQLLYVRSPNSGAGGEPAIKIFDVKDEEKREKNVLDGVGGFDLSADGKKILVPRGGQWAILDARADQRFDKPIPLDGLTAEINPREEWQQIFNEAWRIMRDFFYVANMHGLDWKAIHDQYQAMLADCVCRDDVAYIIKEMISELNVGHAYYWAGDSEQGPAVSVGLLGVDFALDKTGAPAGAYRITRIYEGAPWDADARGPFSQPGVKVKVGDYLLAVNGVPLDPARSPWAAFQGLAGKTVTLTISDQPVLRRTSTAPSGEASTRAPAPPEAAPASQTTSAASAPTTAPESGQRDVVVELRHGDLDLRYRAWVERNRAYVAQKTGGKVGYIHVINTGGDGQAELFRQFFGQREVQALIIDDRWNGGGQIPDRVIELLNRPLYGYWARRYGHDGRTPQYSQQGPKCMLINGLAGSGGDAFPAFFRKAGLGKLIGARTWGGLVGISGNPTLIDNVFVTVPTFGFYKLDGTWTIEGHGVDPDIAVIDDPAKMVDGGDPQLDAAIQNMLEELQKHPFVPPKRPADPDKRGMGIQDRDK